MPGGPHTELIPEIAACRGLAAEEIARHLSPVPFAELSRWLLAELGRRTDPGCLDPLPYRTAHTLYGDDGVVEGFLTQRTDGFSVADEPDGASDASITWERWEDIVRLLNGDVPALALLYGRSVVVEPHDRLLSEPPWFRAVAFSTGGTQAQNDVISRLAAAADDRAELDRCVDQLGTARIAAALSVVVGATLVEAGGREDLEGSFMRSVVPGPEPVVAQIDFAPDTARPTLRMPGPDGDDGDHAGGVTIRYRSPDVLVTLATGERRFDELLINALVRVDASPDRLSRFGNAVTRVGELHGIL